MFTLPAATLRKGAATMLEPIDIRIIELFRQLDETTKTEFLRSLCYALQAPQAAQVKIPFVPEKAVLKD